MPSGAFQSEPLTLPSVMAETNGGGSPEDVPGFDLFRAVTAGFDTRRIVGPTILSSRPDGGFFSQGGVDVGNAPIASGSPAGKPENVIGVDNRVMVATTSMTPWRCICHLEVEFERGPVGLGTGFLVGPHTLLTAAHVLVDTSRDGWKKPRRASRVRIVPGRNATLAPYGYFVTGRDEIGLPQAWRRDEIDQEEAARYDIAAVTIPEEKNQTGEKATVRRLGYFGVKALGPEAEKDVEFLFVNNAGYPFENDKPYGTLWYNAGRVSHIEGSFVDYMVDTEGGQSGSPIYVYDERTMQRHVIAIHTTGDFVNRGLRITPEIFRMICGWVGPERPGVEDARRRLAEAPPPSAPPRILPDDLRRD